MPPGKGLQCSHIGHLASPLETPSAGQLLQGWGVGGGARAPADGDVTSCLLGLCARCEPQWGPGASEGLAQGRGGRGLCLAGVSPAPLGGRPGAC